MTIGGTKLDMVGIVHSWPELTLVIVEHGSESYVFLGVIKGTYFSCFAMTEMYGFCLKSGVIVKHSNLLTQGSTLMLLPLIRISTGLGSV